MSGLKRWIVPLCTAITAIVFFETGRWWQRQSDAEAATKIAVAPPALPMQQSAAVSDRSTTQTSTPTKQQPAQTPALMPVVPVDQHRQWTATECPPHLDAPQSSTEFARTLWRYYLCYSADLHLKRTDRFFATADFLYEHEIRDDGWAQAIESKVDEVRPHLTHVKLGDGSCHTNLCRYDAELPDAQDLFHASSSVQSELEMPLHVQIVGMGYNASIMDSLPQSVGHGQKVPGDFKVYIFRADVPSAFLQQFTTLLDQGGEAALKADGG